MAPLVISDRLRLTVLAGFLDRRISFTPDFGYSRHPPSLAVRLKKTPSKSELIRKSYCSMKLLTIQLKGSPHRMGRPNDRTTDWQQTITKLDRGPTGNIKIRLIGITEGLIIYHPASYYCSLNEVTCVSCINSG